MIGSLAVKEEILPLWLHQENDHNMHHQSLQRNQLYYNFFDARATAVTLINDLIIIIFP